MSYHTTIYESVAAIPSEAWDALCAPSGEVFMDLRVLAAVEQSMAADGKFQYLILRDVAERPMACAAVSLYRIDGAVLASGALKKFVHGVRRVWGNYLRMKILFCGLPVSAGQKSLILHPQADPAAVATELDRVLSQLAKELRAWFIVVKECDAADLAQLDRLQDHGYLRGDSLPMNHFEPRFRDLDDFCQALRSHYRYKINKSLKKFALAGMRLETLVEPECILATYTEQVHRLYVAVVERAEHKLEILPAEFFREMVRRLPGEMSLSLVLQDERIVAFAWGLFHQGVFQNLFIGVDYSLNTDVDLYFNTMLRSIDFGICRSEGYFRGAVGRRFQVARRLLSPPALRLPESDQPPVPLARSQVEVAGIPAGAAATPARFVQAQRSGTLDGRFQTSRNQRWPAVRPQQLRITTAWFGSTTP